MNINALDNTFERYQSTLASLKAAKKMMRMSLWIPHIVGDLVFEREDAIDENVKFLDDLAVLELFFCFERYLRIKVDNLALPAVGGIDAALVSLVKEHAEYIKLEEVLDSLKVVCPANDIGFVKQIKKYRDWVAHGRNPRKPPPAQVSSVSTVYSILKTVMSQVN